MKKAAQLDWTDLQEIAKMKGVGVLAPPVPAPANTECSSSESEHEPASVAPMCHAAQGSQSATPENHTSPSGLGRLGSPEKEPEIA